MAGDKRLTRPLFAPPAAPVHTLPATDTVRTIAARAMAAEIKAEKRSPLEKVQAEEAAKVRADREEIAEIIGAAAAKRFGVLFENLVTRLSDDLYNSAVLANPRAFAAAYGRSGSAAISDTAKSVKVYRNDFDVAVVVVGRADNPASDILSVHVGAAEVAPADAQMHRNDGTFAMVLRPGQTLFGAVRAATPGTATIVFTAVPLRGRAVVFGG